LGGATHGFSDLCLDLFVVAPHQKKAFDGVFEGHLRVLGLLINSRFELLFGSFFSHILQP
jgi:hypothetical protein